MKQSQDLDDQQLSSQSKKREQAKGKDSLDGKQQKKILDDFKLELENKEDYGAYSEWDESMRIQMKKYREMSSFKWFFFTRWVNYLSYDDVQLKDDSQNEQILSKIQKWIGSWKGMTEDKRLDFQYITDYLNMTYFQQNLNYPGIVQYIQNSKSPKNMKEVREFLDQIRSYQKRSKYFFYLKSEVIQQLFLKEYKEFIKKVNSNKDSTAVAISNNSNIQPNTTNYSNSTSSSSNNQKQQQNATVQNVVAKTSHTNNKNKETKTQEPEIKKIIKTNSFISSPQQKECKNQQEEKKEQKTNQTKTNSISEKENLSNNQQFLTNNNHFNNNSLNQTNQNQKQIATIQESNNNLKKEQSQNNNSNDQVMSLLGYQIQYQKLNETELKTVSKGIACPDNDVGQECSYQLKYGIECPYGHNVLEIKLAQQESLQIFKLKQFPQAIDSI